MTTLGVGGAASGGADAWGRLRQRLAHVGQPATDGAPRGRTDVGVVARPSGLAGVGVLIDVWDYLPCGGGVCAVRDCTS